MSDVLARICTDKLEHIKRKQAERPIAGMEQAAKSASSPRGFVRALQHTRAQGRYGLICEIKKASPSKGLIRADFDPLSLARAYEEGGATCLSVLTDIPYFQGSDDFLIAARGAASLPVLRKDFMIDPYQVIEARALGADCILLIMAALSDAQAAELESTAFEWGMDVLLEVHDKKELDQALRLKSPLLGINNRNLKTLNVNLDVSVKLAAGVPGDRILVGESGIYSRADLDRLNHEGVGCFLIGESLMRQADVAAATAKLLKNPATV